MQPVIITIITICFSKYYDDECFHSNSMEQLCGCLDLKNIYRVECDSMLRTSIDGNTKLRSIYVEFILDCIFNHICCSNSLSILYKKLALLLLSSAVSLFLF